MGDSIPDLLSRLRVAFRRDFGIWLTRVELFTNEHAKRPAACLPIPPWEPPPQEPAAREHQASLKGQLSPSPLMRRILKAVAGMDAEEPTITEIAAAVKMRADPYLRKTLGAMRTLGFLGGVNDDAAFPITPKGLDCINGGQEP